MRIVKFVKLRTVTTLYKYKVLHVFNDTVGYTTIVFTVEYCVILKSLLLLTINDG